MTSENAKKHVAVLMGGLSAEREVSLSSGRGCAAALREAGYEVIEVDALDAVGPLMRFAVEEFGSKGRHFVDQAELIEALRAEQAGSTLLIKGSRSAALDKVVAALCGVSGEIH